uniref:ATP synthase subunit delta n=1 Tax=Chlorobium chlorochromatii (strain CaD3) TaxID=340177 RepID=ATPD_CHLCH|nr:RecName: Full=ATP synthase subunit delta; AltName: Full=ATP synthase F(1) sector subunit delta; AltName: Full=F-type ATPase subunit delta; Short=F-ATPase subunit delta [Chlorobium chlorochromatii CaD3]
MSVVIASRRYANALLSVVEESNTIDKTLDEMNAISEVLHHSRDLVHALKSPLISYDKKIHIVEEVFKGRVSETVMFFLKLVGKKNRLGHLPHIVDEFKNLLDEDRGIINVDITSAVELSDEQANELVATIANMSGKQVRATLTVNEELIAGAAVKIADTIIDGTVRHQLSKLRSSLVAA